MIQGTIIEMPTFEATEEHDEFELDVRVTVTETSDQVNFSGSDCTACTSCYNSCATC
uniref:Uncharacterized protein n=1 Tax=Thermosporothrix sp. COM3 TaxID=2490863 RepID=A0A455SKK3_9CHLR|nr:hypothetical protein KTC_26590 [Thermosporothrix sp. COM3]